MQNLYPNARQTRNLLDVLVQEKMIRSRAEGVHLLKAGKISVNGRVVDSKNPCPEVVVDTSYAERNTIRVSVGTKTKKVVVRPDVRCRKCWAPATWHYMPYSQNVEQRDKNCCDRCVPRGCSCNMILRPGIAEVWDMLTNMIMNPIEDYEVMKDKQGRALPCCEWEYLPWFWNRIEP